MDNKKGCSRSEEVEVRKGPWTMEEDLILMNYIANHGEGVWNTLARSAGLKRTGKSCRLRWLNYLSPGVKRGNITPEEQLLIMDLHAKWGNRWSKIAKYLPGRTDNEIKNFWRTRIQKHMKQPTNGQSSSSSDHHHQQHQQQQNTNNNNDMGDHQGNNTSQISSSYGHTDHVVDRMSYSSSPACSFTHPPAAGGAMEAFQSPTTFPTPDSNENLWSMEDLWSLHLLNGD